MQIKFYWTEFGERPDKVFTVKSPQLRGLLMMVKGMQLLEEREHWQNMDEFQVAYTAIHTAAEVHIAKLKALHKLDGDKWDWDWV